jgi:hypothetical protein
MILRIPMTEKWPFQKQKSGRFGFGRIQETTFFFSRKPIFCFTTLIQLPIPSSVGGGEGCGGCGKCG